MASSNEILNKKINSKLTELQKNKDHKKYWNITWRSGEFLSNLITLNKPKFVLEIGTSNGFSTLWLVKNLDQNSKLFSVEVDKNRFDIAKNNLNFIENIEIINEEIFELLDKNYFDVKFDFVFLDAAHKKYKEIIEKLIEKKLLNEKATVVADNINSHSYMDQFVKYVEEKFSYKIINLDSGFIIIKVS